MALLNLPIELHPNPVDRTQCQRPYQRWCSSHTVREKLQQLSEKTQPSTVEDVEITELGKNTVDISDELAELGILPEEKPETQEEKPETQEEPS